MDFFEAIKAMDDGKIVRMAVNPTHIFKLAKDGCTFVMADTDSNGIYHEDDWRNAVFYSSHIRWDWEIVESRPVKVVP